MLYPDQFKPLWYEIRLIENATQHFKIYTSVCFYLFSFKKMALKFINVLNLKVTLSVFYAQIPVPISMKFYMDKL